MKHTINKWFLFISIALGPFMVGIDFLAISIAIEPLATFFHVKNAMLQWFISAYAIGCASFLMISGKFIDRYGSKSVFSIGTALFMISSLFIASTDNVWFAISARFFQGVGGGFLSTSATSIIAQQQNIKERGIWFSRLIGAVGLGMTLGPSFGGFLVQNYGWKTLFLINVPVALLALIFSYFALPKESIPKLIERPMPFSVNLL